MVLSTLNTNNQQLLKRKERDVHDRAVKVCSQLKRYGVHSINRMRTAGFEYTGEGDTVRCKLCNLEVSKWIREIDPYLIHLARSPDCSFVRSVLSKNKLTLSERENETKRQRLEMDGNEYNLPNKLIELEALKQARRRTFSHWPHQVSPTKDQMIDAGFFQCNVGDRVICIYCNLICQQWKRDVDDPIEVHKVLSPKCPYILSILTQNETSSFVIMNGISTDNNNNHATLLNTANRLESSQIVYTSPCHANYASILNREATFATWTNASLPSVDDLVKAGFFYTGAKNIVTCFYCNGSLQNWGNKDKPLIEHIRWFPHCAYAKQLSGDELYNKVQVAKRFRQGSEQSHASLNATHNPSTTNNPEIQTMDESQLSRLVAARLDLPMSQRLLGQNFKLSVVKRCWEDQLRLKHDDFLTDCDLLIACIILQKQIEHINGNKDKIIVPSIRMKSIANNEEEPSTSLSLPTILPEKAPEQSMTVNSTNEQTTAITETKVPVNNPCVLCNQEEKRLACIPCGHLAACISCSKTLRTCPVCRRGIEAFVRIYI